MEIENALNTIRTALAGDATPELKTAGIAACRAIISVLEPMSPSPVVATAPTLNVAALVGALRGVPPDQLLDLAIARLRAALPTGVQAPPAVPVKFQIVPIAPLATPPRGAP